jgi:hypothetical protein
MQWNTLRARFFAAAIAAAVGMPLSSIAADSDKSGGKEKEKQSQSEKSEHRKLKAFELEHRDPQQIQQILALHKQTNGASAAHHPAARVGAAALSRQHKGLASAVDTENKILFVRGSEDEIQQVEKLVDAFDVKDGKLEKHKFCDLQLIPIRQKTAPQVQSTLTQLQLDHKLIQLGDLSLVVLREGDSEKSEKKLEQSEKVISKLDAKKSKSGEEDEERDGDKNKDKKEKDE